MKQQQTTDPSETLISIIDFLIGLQPYSNNKSDKGPSLWSTLVKNG